MEEERRGVLYNGIRSQKEKGDIGTMDKKENLRCALTGQPHDWVPASFFFHLKPHELEGEACTRFHVNFYRKTDVDFLKVMHDGLTAPCTLSPQGLGELKDYRPGRESNAYVSAYLDRVCRVSDALGGDAAVYANIFSPFTLLRRIGEERLLSYIREDASAVRDVLCRMAEDIGWMAEQMVRKAGCMGNFLAFQGAESNLFSVEEYEDWIQESDRILLDAANQASPYNILHFCGWNQVKNHLEVWKEYPGCAVNWAIYVEDLSLEEGRKYFGMRPVMGGFDNRKTGLLYCGSQAQVEEETRRIIEAYRRAFGSTDTLILGADCSFLTDFSPERFRWVLDTAKAGLGGRRNDGGSYGQRIV